MYEQGVSYKLRQLLARRRWLHFEQFIIHDSNMQSIQHSRSLKN